MQFNVRVKTGTHRDRLWRDGAELLVHLRDDSAGRHYEHLTRFLAGSLRLAKSLISIKRPHPPAYQVTIRAQPADLELILDSLPLPPSAGLFDDEAIL
jgi:uncharacterized protein YggU (UPF0235/DUF167 family)